MMPEEMRLSYNELEDPAAKKKRIDRLIHRVIVILLYVYSLIPIILGIFVYKGNLSLNPEFTFTELTGLTMMALGGVVFLTFYLFMRPITESIESDKK